MSGTALFAYALALGLAAATPGPGVVALVARAIGSGFAPAMGFVAGLIVGDVFYLLMAVFGLSFLADLLGSLFTVVRWAGAAYLAYLAWRLWRAAGDPARIGQEAGRGVVESAVSGLAVTLGNPKTIVFYLALLPAIVDLASIGAADVPLLVLVTAVVLGVVMTPYAALASRARFWLARPGTQRRLHRGAALVMAGAAIWTVGRAA
ncbi:LysE family translocator [Aureimonas jatrophae]|uniref:Threonine/homoserine/homoserine lactone efflux protein n=1 Tax=Aureimonas jatrophae TaxID=1166073 RepID=A0A1H0IIL9_9HYPH|nr:LysE family translocator [Aureimonas jatrophae]MBB3952193.1 threonine/homoserine/homoserine lactone efflux protein [Aureimonas jatrophae]SDO31252.1 Threonine/homoserine/homoserine lactone efflux protein [Aureimonas jatrophae]